MKVNEKPSPDAGAKETTQDIVWPEPVPRSAPVVRTVVAPPSDAQVSLPDCCQPLGGISKAATEEAQRIWLVEQHQIDLW